MILATASQNSERSHCKKTFVAEYASTCLQFCEICLICQNSTLMQKYKTMLVFPVSSLFENFSMDIASPYKETSTGNKYLHIGGKNLTGWPLTVAAKNDIADMMLNLQ